jgi:uncharacterized protein YjlB
VITARPGDVIVLPAGTGHKETLPRAALWEIVGAYPAGQSPDMCTPLIGSLKRQAAAIARVPLPQRDPVYGEGGPMFQPLEDGRRLTPRLLLTT